MALIWLHGLGDTPFGWSHLETDLIKQHGLKLVWRAPQAPLAPVTCNFGSKSTSWFDMDAIPVGDGGGRGNLQDIKASAKNIHSLIEELENEGIPPEKVVIGGFSQGALLAMHAALTYPRKVAGAVSFSGWLSEFDVHESNAQTHVLWIHGTHDDIVPVYLHDSGVDELRKKGVEVQDTKFKMGHHFFGAPQTRILATFLTKVLGPECTSA